MIEWAREEHPEMPIERLCSLMGVSRPWYYGRSEAEKTNKDVELRYAIERIVLQFPGYGYRRVTVALKREGWSVNHKRGLRVMVEESLLCQIKRRFKPTTDSTHAFARYPNLLKDTEIDSLDEVWLSDITYVRLPTNFCYLAAILDAYSRRCVGWRLSRQIDTSLTLSALEMALAARRPAAGLIHHSDQGVQPGFKGSSQHLDDEELLWDNARDDARIGPSVRRCARLAGRMWRTGRIGSGSGSRSPAACRVRTPPWNAAYRRRSGRDGSARMGACRRSTWPRSRGVTCRWPRERRLPCVGVDEEGFGSLGD